MTDEPLFTVGESMTRQAFFERLAVCAPDRQFTMTSEFDGGCFFDRVDAETRHWLNVAPSGDATARIGDERFVRRAGKSWQRVVADMDPELEPLVLTALHLGSEHDTTPTDDAAPADDEPRDASADPFEVRQQRLMPTTVIAITERRGHAVYLITSDGLVGDDRLSSVDLVTMDGHLLESTFRINGARPTTSRAVLLDWGIPQDDHVRAALASDARIDVPTV